MLLSTHAVCELGPGTDTTVWISNHVWKAAMLPAQSTAPQLRGSFLKEEAELEPKPVWHSPPLTPACHPDGTNGN